MRHTKTALRARSVDKHYKPDLSPEALGDVQKELEAYCSIVLQSGLSAVSQGIYIDFADKFVRWLAGDFTPGSVKDRYEVRLPPIK